MKRIDVRELDPTTLSSLLDLSRELLQLEDQHEIMDAIMGHSMAILGGERGFVVLKRGEEGLDFNVVRNWSRAELEEGDGEPVSRSILARVFTSGEPLLIEDALADERYGQKESVLRMGIRSVLAAPLLDDDKMVGALYIESRSLDSLFGPGELTLFQHILELSSRALERCIRRLSLEHLAKSFFEQYDFGTIITRDPAFLNVLQRVALVAETDYPVLVQGASGTGKELIVRALHQNSHRADQPFHVVNCGAINPSTLESELFGHRRGAFTGATGDHPGLIAAADNGSVFLDEIGEMPQELQVKLLRTLQFGEVHPVGAVRPRQVDVRFFAATNRNLADEVAAGRFREDLYYRLNVVPIELPPLRDRPDDIIPLFEHFLDRYTRLSRRPIPTVTPELRRVLKRCPWPGNVRQLENETQALLATTPPGEPLTPERLSPGIVTGPESPSQPRALSLKEQQRQAVIDSLKRNRGNRTQTAKELDISREGLRKMLQRLEIEPEEYAV